MATTVHRNWQKMHQAVGWLCLLGSLLLPHAVGAEPLVIKFATLAPDGTPWMKIMEEMNHAVQEQSGGQLAFRFYSGGVAGDERDVLRKIRINQLHGGAFSGFGLGDVLSETRVLELPLLFHSAEEADHVAAALFEPFRVSLAAKGFHVLALQEVGAVYLFSKEPIRGKADMARAKIWSWQGDPLPQAIFQAYGITPVPLSLPNVLPSLQSGLIDACYGTPLTILGLQWFSKVKYRTSLAVTHVMGAFLLSNTLWQQLTPVQQTLLRDLMHTYHHKAATAMRQYDVKALALLESPLGLETIDMADDEVERLHQISDRVRQELRGKLYPPALLDQVLRLRDAYRQAHPQD